MENLVIDNTNRTPFVKFTVEGNILLRGRSTPEDAAEFYDHLYNWVIDYIKEPAEITTIDIEMEYFNSGSSKAILTILELLVKHLPEPDKLVINWHYEEGDDDILERGEHFESIINLKFNFIEHDILES